MEDTCEVNEVHLFQLQSTANCIFMWSIMTCFYEFFLSKKVKLYIHVALTVYMCDPDVLNFMR